MEILEFLKSSLRESLRKGNDETIDALKKILNNRSNKFHDLILLEGRFEDIKKKSIIGTISEEEKQVEHNKIRESLLHFINSLKSLDLKEEEHKEEKDSQQPQVAKQPNAQRKASRNADIDSTKTSNDQNGFQASVKARNKSGEYLSIKVTLHNEEHHIEYKDNQLSPTLFVDGTEVGRKGTSSNVAKILLSGFTLGLIKERTSYTFTLSDHPHNYPSSLELAFGMTRNFVGIKLKVKGVIVIDEGKV